MSSIFFFFLSSIFDVCLILKIFGLWLKPEREIEDQGLRIELELGLRPKGDEYRASGEGQKSKQIGAETRARPKTV